MTIKELLAQALMGKTDILEMDIYFKSDGLFIPIRLIEIRQINHVNPTSIVLLKP